MPTFDDIRARGYTVELAWKGGDDGDDVYTVSRPASGDDPAAADYVGGTLSYVPDTPDSIGSFLHLTSERRLDEA